MLFVLGLCAWPRASHARCRNRAQHAGNAPRVLEAWVCEAAVLIGREKTC